MLSTSQLHNLKEAAKCAHDCELITHIPAELILAQWVIESGWGQHSPGNNCFGIKKFPGCGGTQLLSTTEYFTREEKDSWMAQSPGRYAELQNGLPSNVGRQKYKVTDWFATFNSLVDCFKKRASLFQSQPYYTYLAQYDLDKDLVKLTRSVAKVYATDPNYANELLQIMGLVEVQEALRENRSK